MEKKIARNKRRKNLLIMEIPQNISKTSRLILVIPLETK
jgi:hypothetical protein